jgi:N-acetylneuraminic acid mutarotase
MNFKKHILFFSLLLFTLYACKDYEYKPINTWKQLSDFPGMARASAICFSSGDKAFMGLGRSGSRYSMLKDLWEYNSISDTWERKSDFPGKARVKAIAGVIGNKAYIGLGCVSAYDGNQFKDLWEYNMAADTWKQMADFPGIGTTDLVCEVVNWNIYVFSGFASTSFNRETYKYDPASNKWTKLSKIPTMRSNAAGFSAGNKVYLGTGFQGANLKDFYSYDTQSDSWTRLADLPEGRILSKGLAINGRGFIMLGRYWNGALNGGKLLSDVVEYSFAEDKWIKCGDFPGKARENMVVFTVKDKGYVVGGEDDVERKRDVWEFRP